MFSIIILPESSCKILAAAISTSCSIVGSTSGFFYEKKKQINIQHTNLIYINFNLTPLITIKKLDYD